MSAWNVRLSWEKSPGFSPEKTLMVWHSRLIVEQIARFGG